MKTEIKTKKMNILFGVVGEGMGHATRSKVLVEHLLQQGHFVQIVTYHKAFDYFQTCYADHPQVDIEKISGLSLSIDGNEVRLGKTIARNVCNAPSMWLKNIHVYKKILQKKKRFDVVISDFESWAHLFAISHSIPLISLSNQHVVSRCSHTSDVTNQECKDFRLLKAFTQAKMPGAYHYLVTSFFFPEVTQSKTTLLSPILREEILSAHREKQEHVLVYQTRSDHDGFVDVLKQYPHIEFRVYGKNKSETDGNIVYKAFDQQGFVEDLRTAKAVVANAGCSLMSEVVHLKIPMLAIPVKNQYEQEMNARYLHRLGYGTWAPELTQEMLDVFLKELPRFESRLHFYPSQGNQVTLHCLDALLDRIQKKLPPISSIQSENQRSLSSFFHLYGLKKSIG